MIYSCKCTKCDNEQDYVSSVADRLKTPLCDKCGEATYKTINSPMVGAMGLTSGSFNVWSPIDGTTLHGRAEYMAHMKKHNVVPESDLKGQVEHVRKQKEADDIMSYRKSAEEAFRKINK